MVEAETEWESRQEGDQEGKVGGSQEKTPVNNRRRSKMTIKRNRPVSEIRWYANLKTL